MLCKNYSETLLENYGHQKRLFFNLNLRNEFVFEDSGTAYGTVGNSETLYYIFVNVKKDKS